MELHKEYLQNPTPTIHAEILANSHQISVAERSLSVHIRRIIRDFKATVNYNATMLMIHDESPEHTHLSDEGPSEEELLIASPNEIRLWSQPSISFPIDVPFENELSPKDKYDTTAHQQTSPEPWWDHDLGSSRFTPGTPDDTETDYDPTYNDDDIAEEIDSYLLAVTKQIERQMAYLLAPTAQKLMEFNEHEGYLMSATRQLNIHSQRIVLTFRAQIGYVGCMDTFIANKRSLEAVRLDQGFYTRSEPRLTFEIENDTSTEHEHNITTDKSHKSQIANTLYDNTFNGHALTQTPT